MKKIVTVQHLEKSYRENKAVKDLSFTVYEDEILGLLGPNGAGKSTTISILSTILKSDGGDITVFDLPLKTNTDKIKGYLGIVPQEIAIYEDISAYRNVAFFASLYGVSKAKLHEQAMNALRFVGLEDKRNDKPKTFSGGMKRRLNIACAIAHEPKLLILDEPTVGIDPQSRNHILRSLLKLKERGTTIIYTTHYMEEVEEIADRVIIMDHGIKIAEGTLKELLQKYKDTFKYTIYLKDITMDLKDKLQSIAGIKHIDIQDDVLKVTVSKEENALDKIVLRLVQEKYHIMNMEIEEGNLETVFLELTGRNLRD